MASLHRELFSCLILALVLRFESGALADSPASTANLQGFLAARHYVQVPLFTTGLNAQAVEATINGRTMKLLLDTGCAVSCLNYPTSRDLRLKVVDTGHKVWGVGGELEDSSGVAQIQSFSIGGYNINRTNIIQVLPRSSPGARDCDGILGLDLLRMNAALILVGSEGLILKPGATSVAPIDSYMKSLGFAPVPMKIKQGALFVDGHLNGKVFHSIIDTGDSFSMFDGEMARSALGRDPIYTSMKEVGVDGKRLSTYRFTPETLDFGGFQFASTTITATSAEGIRKHGVDALLGYDLLAGHLAIIDLGSNILWMK